jgi:hypothetical protein
VPGTKSFFTIDTEQATAKKDDLPGSLLESHHRIENRPKQKMTCPALYLSPTIKYKTGQSNEDGSPCSDSNPHMGMCVLA